MICEICHKNEANIVFQVLNNGRLNTRTICTECAMKMQKDFFKTLHALGIQQSLVKKEEGKQTSVDVPDRFCINCSQPLTKVDENNTLGCPACYQAMKGEIIQLLSTDVNNGSDENSQKQPEGSDLELMSHQLREAIVSEDYEQAAALRDKIRQLANSGENPHE